MACVIISMSCSFEVAELSDLWHNFIGLELS